MITATLTTLFTRDLQRLSKEIASYRDEKNLWRIEQQIQNSAGNLCLHLIGNLNTYIGKELGGTGYQRNRALEFSAKHIPKIQLVKMVDETIAIVKKALDQLSENDLVKEYPLIVFDKPTSTEYFLVHLVGHLSYHLGQVNYHRRLLDN